MAKVIHRVVSIEPGDALDSTRQSLSSLSLDLFQRDDTKDDSGQAGHAAEVVGQAHPSYFAKHANHRGSLPEFKEDKITAKLQAGDEAVAVGLEALESP